MLDLECSNALDGFESARQVVTVHGRRRSHFERDADAAVSLSFVFLLGDDRYFLAERLDDGRDRLRSFFHRHADSLTRDRLAAILEAAKESQRRESKHGDEHRDDIHAAAGRHPDRGH